MLRLYIVLLFYFIFYYDIFAQDKLIIADFELINEDTVFFTYLPEVDILDFKDKQEKNSYLLLKKRVLKVYPYAIIAKQRLEKINLALDTIPKRRKKKRHIKEVTKWIKNEYSDRLKSLTMKEGQILVKLIYRETNFTTYDIVRFYRGRFNAFFWQTMAKFWDNDLKKDYNPENNREDMFIEYIIKEAKLEKILK